MMKGRVRHGRLFVFTTGAPTCIFRLSAAIIGITTFRTIIPMPPFLRCKKLQAVTVSFETSVKLRRRKALKK